MVRPAIVSHARYLLSVYMIITIFFRVVGYCFRSCSCHSGKYFSPFASHWQSDILIIRNLPRWCIRTDKRKGHYVFCLTSYFVSVSTLTRQNVHVLVFAGNISRWWPGLEMSFIAQNVFQLKLNIFLNGTDRKKGLRPSKNGLLWGFNRNHAFLNLIQHFLIIMTGIILFQMTFWHVRKSLVNPVSDFHSH